MSRLLPFVLALIVAVFFGVSKVLIRKAPDVNPFLTVFYTLILAPLMLLGFSIANGDLFNSYNYDLRTVVNLALSGLTFLVAGRVFAYGSIHLIGAARSSQLTSTQVIFAAALSVLFLQETMSLMLIAGTLAIFVGTILISFSHPHGTANTVLPAQNFSKGFVFGLLGGFLWGVSQLFAREGVRGLGSSIMASLITYLFAITIILFLLLGLRREVPRFEGAQTPYVLASGMLTTFALLAQYTALRIAPVVIVTPIVNISPLITLLVSFLFIQKVELVNAKVVFGALMIVLGAVIITLYA